MSTAVDIVPRDVLATVVAEEEDEQQAELELSLGALREGSVHFCQGPLQRKRHRAQAKIKKWKQKWFKVEQGEYSPRGDSNNFFTVHKN